MHQTKGVGEAFGPFKVVQQRPVEVPKQLDTSLLGLFCLHMHGKS